MFKTRDEARRVLGFALLSTNLLVNDEKFLATSHSNFRAAMAYEIEHGVTMLLAAMQHHSKAPFGFG